MRLKYLLAGAYARKYRVYAQHCEEVAKKSSTRDKL